jgi:hypothetical protein
MLASWNNSAVYIHGVASKSVLMSDLSLVSASVRGTAQIGLSALDSAPPTAEAKATEVNAGSVIDGHVGATAPSARALVERRYLSGGD